MEAYNYEVCPQGLAIEGNERNLNYWYLFDHIQRALRTKKILKILEIGTGGGRNLQALNGRFSDKVDLYGTDISSTALSYAASLKIGKFSLAESDVIPFDEKFDLILLIDVLEHLDSPATVARTIGNAQAYLNESGSMYISIPVELNKFSLTWIFSKFKYLKNLTRQFYGHVVQFTINDVHKVVHVNNAEVRDIFYSVHSLSQIQVLILFYLPKLFIHVFLAKQLANDLRDSNTLMGSESSSVISLARKALSCLSSPVAYLGFKESCFRKKSCFAAGNMHLLIGNKL